jgi:hypothetical protein
MNEMAINGNAMMDIKKGPVQSFLLAAVSWVGTASFVRLYTAGWM